MSTLVLSGVTWVDVLGCVLTKPELCLTLKQLSDEEDHILFLTQIRLEVRIGKSSCVHRVCEAQEAEISWRWLSQGRVK